MNKGYLPAFSRDLFDHYDVEKNLRLDAFHYVYCRGYQFD